MIIVGSVDSANKISSFSQTPGNGGCVTSSGKKTCFKDVFLVAPGQSIYSTYMGGGYAVMSGTSMATPYVSGVAAVVLGASPFLTPQQVASIMFESAIDLGAKGTDAVYGRGLVNLPGALAPLGTQTIATSGATASTARGARRVKKSRVSGVLSAGLRGSQIARDVVFFDSYGRDYRTDLTGAAGTSATSLAGVIAQNGQTGRGYLFAGDGFSLSGFVSDELPNTVVTAGFADRQVADLSDVIVVAKLSDDTSMIVGHEASLVGHINKLDLAASEAYDGLFMSASALNSPFMALTSDATFVGAAVEFGDGLAFTAGHAQSEETGTSIFDDEILSAEEAYAYLSQDSEHLRSAQNTVAAMSWRFAPWGIAGLNIAHTKETNSLLGTAEQGALALTADAATTSVGVGARANLGDDWVASVSWSRGETDASPIADGLFNSFSSIESQAYGVALSKFGVFGKGDSIGFAVSRPLHITRGSAVMTASTGVTDDREILYSTEIVNLASTSPETDFEIGYSAQIDDEVMLQANAMYQQDVGGEPGEGAIAAFVTLKTAW